MIFTLIGGNVEKSKSPRAHNAAFEALSLDATYTRQSLRPEEVVPFLKRGQFHGLSVTMPYKETVIPHLDEVTPMARKIGAVNTVEVREGKLIGHNTDGEGAIKAIEELTSLAGKRVVIIGAGGAAKAIAHTAADRKAKVTILNRTLEKAEALAECVGGKAATPDFVPEYDILINCTPSPMPIDPKAIRPRALIMDIRNTQEEECLLSIAEKKGARTIHGREMWINQAIAQQEIWFSGKIERTKSAEVLREALN